MTVMVLLDLRVKPDQVKAMQDFIAEVLPDTRADAGCRLAEFYQDQDDPTHMVLYEHFDSREAYQRYFAWRESSGTLERFTAMMAAPLTIAFFDSLPA